MSAPLKPVSSPTRAVREEKDARLKGKGKAVEGSRSDSESSSGEVETSLLTKFRKVAQTSTATTSSQPQASTSKSTVIVIDDSSDEELAVQSCSRTRDRPKEEEQEVDQLDDAEKASQPVASISNGPITDDAKENIMRLWREEVPKSGTPSRYDWTAQPRLPQLSELMRSRETVFALQRKAGEDEKLGLLARRKILERISRHRRLKSTGKSHAAGCLKRYESFCLDYNIPMFPPADAILALFYGTRARKNNASEATKRKDLQQLKSLLDPTTSLYSCDPSNKALSELQQYPGSTAALEEYLKGGTSEDRCLANLVEQQRQAYYTFPSAHPGLHGFTEAHCAHYLELQGLYHSEQISTSDARSLSRYIGVLHQHPPWTAGDAVRYRQARHYFEEWLRLKLEKDSDAEQRQARDESQPKRPATASPSPALQDPSTKRPRLSSLDERDPSPTQDQPESSSKPPKVESPPPPPPSVVPDPSASSSELLVEQPEPEEQASPIIETSNSTNPDSDSKPSLEAPQPEQPDPPSAPSTSAALRLSPQLPLRPKPRPSRVSLLAQSALSSPVVDPPVPLSIDSLRTFFSSLSSSLAFLAEPLHSSGLDTFEVLSLFAAFEVDTRIRMVVLACQRAGVEVKEEHLETLEGAIEKAKETDWA